MLVRVIVVSGWVVGQPASQNFLAIQVSNEPIVIINPQHEPLRGLRVRYEEFAAQIERARNGRGRQLVPICRFGGFRVSGRAEPGWPLQPA